MGGEDGGEGVGSSGLESKGHGWSMLAYGVFWVVAVGNLQHSTCKQALMKLGGHYKRI